MPNHLVETTAIDKPDVAALIAILLGMTSFGLSLGLAYPSLSLILAERGVAPGSLGDLCGMLICAPKRTTGL